MAAQLLVLISGVSPDTEEPGLCCAFDYVINSLLANDASDNISVRWVRRKQGSSGLCSQNQRTSSSLSPPHPQILLSKCPSVSGFTSRKEPCVSPGHSTGTLNGKHPGAPSMLPSPSGDRGVSWGTPGASYPAEAHLLLQH